MRLPRSRLARRALLALGVVLALIGIGLAPLGWAIGQGEWDRWRRCRGYTRFDPRGWQDTTLAYGPRATRGCMVDDLLARHPLRGRPRAAVVALLGEPRPTDYFREYDLVYWLGPERGFISIDSEWLVIRLDAAGRVAEARLATD